MGTLNISMGYPETCTVFPLGIIEAHRPMYILRSLVFYSSVIYINRLLLIVCNERLFVFNTIAKLIVSRSIKTGPVTLNRATYLRPSYLYILHITGTYLHSGWQNYRKSRMYTTRIYAISSLYVWWGYAYREYWTSPPISYTQVLWIFRPRVPWNSVLFIRLVYV